MMNGMKDNLKVAVPVALLTVVGQWFMFARDIPTRSEVASMITVQAPYRQDAQAIRHRLESLESSHRETKALYRQTLTAINELRIAIGKLEAALEIVEE
jgi:hypothetical protein